MGHSDDEWNEEDIDELEDIEDDVDLPPLTEAAVHLHEMYLALIDGGFDTYDALRMVTWLISEQGIGEMSCGDEDDDE